MQQLFDPSKHGNHGLRENHHFQKKTEIPIRFNYSTFKKRVRLAGRSNSKINLESISWLGVDLTNFEFYNTKWQKADFPTYRKMIVNEKLLEENKNFDEVTQIYNQLRKNFESKLLFNDSSDFFIGELESVRKALVKGTIREKLLSFPYALYKIFASKCGDKLASLYMNLAEKQEEGSFLSNINQELSKGI